MLYQRAALGVAHRVTLSAYPGMLAHECDARFELGLVVMTLFKKFTFAVLLCAAGLALSSCREAEQKRPLFYEKGEYGGKADEKLDQQKRDELRLRGQYQSYN